jgi:hypothetical protein
MTIPVAMSESDVAMRGRRKGTYQENSLAVGLRPRGAAEVLLFRLHGGGRGVVWGSLMGAGGAGGPLLRTASEEGILSVGLEPKTEGGGREKSLCGVAA